MEEHNNELLQRFLTYVAFDTQSKSSAKHSPSSAGQMKLALHLQQELIELGLQDVNVTKHAVVTAYLPSNHPDLTHTIGFISHLDTSPQCSGKNVQPEVIENYRGGDIALGLGEEFISPVYYPFLHQLIGKTLIVTDGTTLLGADNKAGIAEIMTALSVLQQKNIPHCNIRVAFTPDEEIGHWRIFLVIGHIPLMVEKWVSSSMRTLMLRRQKLPLKVGAFILVMLKIN